MGASRPEQVRENAASLDVARSADLRERLDRAGAPPTLDPYLLFDVPRDRLSGGAQVTDRRAPMAR